MVFNIYICYIVIKNYRAKILALVVRDALMLVRNVVVEPEENRKADRNTISSLKCLSKRGVKAQVCGLLIFFKV